MSLNLNGSSQYVSLGNGVDVLSTLPITLACVVQSDTLVAGGIIGYFSQGQYVANRGWGAFAYSGPPKKQSGYGAPSTEATVEWDGANNAITADTGWYLALVTFRSNSGSSIEVTVSAYRYNTATWTTEETVTATPTTQTAFTAPGAGDPSLIGALNISGSATDFWPTLYSWVAIFDQDYGTAPHSNANAQELVANGAWNLLNSHCKLFIPFRNATTDESGNGHDGTLVGSPAYDVAGPGELPPASAGGFMTLMGSYWGP